MRLRADMHVHSYYSDGCWSPLAAAKKAKENGLDFVVLTDHDTTAGTDEFLAVCKDLNLLSVKGTEISAYDGPVKVHILAYNIDTNSDAYKAFYKNLLEGSIERGKDILQKLKGEGIVLSLDDVLAKRQNDVSPLHAMYIAQTGAEKGYGKDKFDFYAKYLNFGMPAFSVISRPSPEETTDAIHDAGGVAFLAHPGRISLNEEDKIKLIERLISHGLDGIEAVYFGHDDEQTKYYLSLAGKYNLLVSGGSDTHGPGTIRQVGVPEFYMSEKLKAAFKLP